MRALILPTLKEGEEFVCDSGCGTTTPEEYDFEYSREEFPNGQVISKTEKAWRSSCCRACVMVYSNVDDSFTPIEDYPAVDAGARETYVFLAPGDVILATDECLADNFKSWNVIGHCFFTNSTYTVGMKPVRRAVPFIRASDAVPIDMLLFCPKCGVQHIDGPEQVEIEDADSLTTPEIQQIVDEADPWRNPPHRSHLCHYCKFIWRPADVPTNGVAAVKTKGKNDSPPPDRRTAMGEPFQDRVRPWMMACFGAEISADRVERNHRFFEEATELVQANGMTRSEAHQLVDYTFDRPVGDLHQEVGGVMVTLAALCLASGQDMHAAGETELARIWTKVDAIRAKQAAKPKHSPLPELSTKSVDKPVHSLTDEQRKAIEWAIGMASQHNLHKPALRELLSASERT